MTPCKRCRLGLCIFYLAITWAAVMPLSGCATLDQIVQKPSVTFDRMVLTDADLLQSTAVFNFNIKNPNPISIRANRIAYDLRIDGRHLIAGQLNHGVTLVAGSTSTMSVPVTLQYLDFYNSVAQLWQSKSADYALTGGFSVGPFTIPFQSHGRIDLPEMPKISLEAVRVDRFTFSGATLKCRLKIDNPNAFNLLYKRLDYSLKLNDKAFAQASTPDQGPIMGNTASFLNFGFDVSFAQIGRSAYHLLQGDNADYGLNGSLILKSRSGAERKIPYNLTGRVPLRR